MISQEIRYVGVNDHAIDLFESQYHVPNGMAYNSYLITDEKTAVIDSVDVHFTEAWLDNIRSVLGGKAPDYIIVQHMEPDHSGSLLRFLETYPAAQVVASSKAFGMIQNFFRADLAGRQVTVGEGDTLSLGRHTLRFITAPMVHWPEVIMTYDSTDKVLFSADAFGKFGAQDAEEDWDDEARRYYIGIVGKYGTQVQAVLKKAAALDIQTICPLHGPVLRENLGHYLDLYGKWSSYTPEEEGILIAYTSVYGNTRKAAEQLAETLKSAGQTVVVRDLARSDMAQAVADAFRYSQLVLATTTYNNDIFPYMREFIEHLTARGFCSRTVGIVENGSWAPAAARVIRGLLEKSKNLTLLEPVVTLRSALSEESSRQLELLAKALCGESCAAEGESCGKKKFVCKICGYVYEGDALPADFVCPICKRGAEDFQEVQ
ncbi:MBL fold metallo-hydrolase [Dysosmobacter sp.]|uniref:MBL fold metallo-hydrolase n=1 Tax=Dysosmobacter sp. TaxID=2591382 RepID=UPI002A8776E1|nr:MBL fold metallo-hydrolase [Dysosmobacter sp.]MDY3281640.1 MBL fold metallo-hydrolase [Dysosmobacter sp.]